MIRRKLKRIINVNNSALPNLLIKHAKYRAMKAKRKLKKSLIKMYYPPIKGSKYHKKLNHTSYRNIRTSKSHKHRKR